MRPRNPSTRLRLAGSVAQLEPAVRIRPGRYRDRLELRAKSRLFEVLTIANTAINTVKCAMLADGISRELRV